VVKVYDSSGKQFGIVAGGYRENFQIAPDGCLPNHDYNNHGWVPINVHGHDGSIYLVPQARTTNNVWLSGIAFSDNPSGLIWRSAVNLYWALNGGNVLGWHSHNWNRDHLAFIAPNTFVTMKVPVVDTGNDKVFYIVTHGNNWAEGAHSAVYVNGTKLDDRMSGGWGNAYQRLLGKQRFQNYYAVRVPAILISEDATEIDVQIDTRTTTDVSFPHRIYLREAGTHDFTTDESYTLPKATNTMLGGVKVDGITIEADEEGTISVVPGSVSASGGMDFSVTSQTATVPATLTADIDNIPLDDPSRTTVLLNTSTDAKITGIDSSGIIPYVPYLLVNNNSAGGNKVTLAKQDGGSQTQNRFLFPDDMDIDVGEFYIISYNPVLGGWTGMIKP